MDLLGVNTTMCTGAYASHFIRDDGTPRTNLNVGKMQRQVEAVAQGHDPRHNAICRSTMPTIYDANSAIAALVELPIVAEEACLEQPLYQIYNVPLKRDVEDGRRSSGIQLDS